MLQMTGRASLLVMMGVGSRSCYAPMLDLGSLPIDLSILAGILVHLMHLEIHSSNKRNLVVEALLLNFLVVPMPMFLQSTFTFAPMFSTRQLVLPLANNLSL